MPGDVYFATGRRTECEFRFGVELVFVGSELCELASGERTLHLARIAAEPSERVSNHNGESRAECEVAAVEIDAQHEAFSAIAFEDRVDRIARERSGQNLRFGFERKAFCLRHEHVVEAD